MQNIAVIGAGGVGGYFAGRLAQAGNKVTIVARGEHGNQIKENGLTIQSPKGDCVVQNIQVVDHVSKLEKPDLIFLGVKAWQISTVGQQLAAVIHPHTLVIPLQNGVMAVPELKESLPANNVMGGLCSIFSKIEAPGIIHHMSAEPTIVFGELNNKLSARAEEIKNILDKAQINCKLSEYIQGDIWKKFVMICLGGLGAIARANYGVLVSTPELRKMLEQMLREMYTVALAERVALKESVIERTMAAMDHFAPSANSSMARDIWSGRPSELEYQNGTVVKLAQKHGIEVPINYMIYHCLLPQELQARK